jgi:hypothetical protein
MQLMLYLYNENCSNSLSNNHALTRFVSVFAVLTAQTLHKIGANAGLVAFMSGIAR